MQEQINENLTKIDLTALAKSRLESLLEARNAEIEDLKLALDAAKKPTDDLVMECDQLRRDLRERDRVIDGLRLDVKEKSRDISLLKTQVRELAAALELANSKVIAPNLDAFKGAVDEAVNPALLEKIAERDREIANLKADINMLKQSHECDLAERDREIKELQNAIDVYQTNIQDHKKGIQELEITAKNHREQFDNLKSHFEVTLKAIAMNLNALKGERKPDRIELVDGVETRYRDYINNLTHHQKTLIIEHMQLAIAEEAKKLKSANLKDFSFDDMPF